MNGVLESAKTKTGLKWYLLCTLIVDGLIGAHIYLKKAKVNFYKEFRIPGIRVRRAREPKNRERRSEKIPGRGGNRERFFNTGRNLSGSGNPSGTGSEISKQTGMTHHSALFDMIDM